MSKITIKTTFEASRTIQPIYTGGSTSLDASGCLLATSVGEDALIVQLKTGDRLASLEGVRSMRFLLCIWSELQLILRITGWRINYQFSE